MLTDWEQVESIRYNTLYANGYPAGGPGWPLSWATKNYPELAPKGSGSILDVGCGLGVLANHFKHYTGIDVSTWAIEYCQTNYTVGKFFVCGVISAPNAFMGEYFSNVVSFDVLEHIPEDHLEESLNALASINTGGFLFSICCRPSGLLGPNGENLHPTVLTLDQWLHRLNRYFGVVGYSEYNEQRTFCVLLR